MPESRVLLERLLLRVLDNFETGIHFACSQIGDGDAKAIAQVLK